MLRLNSVEQAPHKDVNRATLRLNIGLASFGPTSAYPSLDLSRLFHVALHELEALQAPRRLGGLASLARLDVE
jgi:hypothetical protein